MASGKNMLSGRAKSLTNMPITAWKKIQNVSPEGAFQLKEVILQERVTVLKQDIHQLTN